MEKLILEIYHPGLSRPEYRTFTSADVAIGRAVGNDLILPDWYVSPSHAVLRKVPEGWIVRDLDSENGVFLETGERRINEALLFPGAFLRIGKTRIRVLTAEVPLAPTRLYKSDHKLTYKLENHWALWGSLLGVVAVYSLEGFMRSYEEMPLLKLMGVALVVLFVSVIWAVIWAVIGRIIKHRNTFNLNLSITCIVNVLFLFWEEIAENFGYLFNSPALQAGMMLALCGLTLLVQLVGHLAASTNLPFRKRVAAAGITTSIFVALGIFIGVSLKDEFRPDPAIFGALKPPVFKVLPSKGIEEFVRAGAQVYDDAGKLDRKK